MASFNSVVLCGNLTRDVELRYTPNQKAVCDIGLAINEKVKSASGEYVDSAVFVDCTLWGRTAEIANEYLRKGSPVLIAGRLQLDTWEHEGQKRSKLKVVCEKLQMLGGKGGGSRSADHESTYTPPSDDFTPTTSRDEADIPFAWLWLAFPFFLMSMGVA